MNEQQDKQTETTTDSANNEVGPTEKLEDKGEELSAPGAQDPDSEIQDEKSPNTE